MIHVVFAEVVLRQIGDIRLLHVGNVGRLQYSYVHGVPTIEQVQDVWVVRSGVEGCEML